MNDLIKGLAWVALLAIAMLFFLVYSIYKLNQRTNLMQQNNLDQDSQGIESGETGFILDTYESNIAMVSEPIVKKNHLSI